MNATRPLTQPALAARQFGAAAAAYLDSAVHAAGADLRRLQALARQSPGLSALDLGCGAGHVAYALAAGGAAVVACDPAAEMLALVEAEARQRGLDKLSTQQGAAEKLPFAAAAFDWVVSRYSAHHWPDVPAAIAEIARVLKPGGSLIVIDIIAPETPLLDTLLQTIEILRDPSHVRDYRRSEWTAMFGAAGFEEPAVNVWRLPMAFAAWTARMKTSALRAEAVQDVFNKAADEARAHFEVAANGDFALDAAWMQAALRTTSAG
ncbi:MAG: class I SAM-dependent methyltransferase [Azonexus sp.]|jgi:SAM-dependent methyltransferase|nr:class I SAM-dependent methyltransferase [Azonexus sp.]